MIAEFMGIILNCNTLLAIIFCLLGWIILGGKKTPSNLRQKLRILRKRIYDNWSDNKTINVIRFQTEHAIFLPEYNNTEIYIKVMDSNCCTKPPQKEVIKSDPFIPPFTEDFLDHLSHTHSLIYNGNSLLRCHLLVITNEFERQNTPINIRDFEAGLKAMKALSGFIFYNSGPDSGSSQLHKHLQVVPYSAFRYGYVPIDALIRNEERIHGSLSGKFFTIPQYKFKHKFYMIPEKITRNLTEKGAMEKAKWMERVYKELLRKLENSDMEIAYNLILTNRWMFVVLRKCEVALDTIKINALGFTGSLVVRTEEDYLKIKSCDPFSVLTHVTFPIS